MPQEIKLWRIESDRPVPVKRAKLSLEDRLEVWLCDDIGLLSKDFLVIGRQVDFGGPVLDLLAIDLHGNLVTIELKRDKTPREVVAQVLEYAALVQQTAREEVERRARDHLNKPLEEAFQEKFGEQLPETINVEQRMYIVASSLDTATSRIVEYLSTHHDVGINVATFAYFETSNGEFVGRSMLLDEKEVEHRARGRRRTYPTEAELRELADNRGVAHMWDLAVAGFGSVAKHKKYSGSTVFFQVSLPQGLGAIASIFPELSSPERGLAVTLVFDHIASALGVEESRITEVCGKLAGERFGGSYSNLDNCFYLSQKQLTDLIDVLSQNAGRVP